MLVDISIIIQEKTTIYDNEGIAIETWTASQTTIDANRQPLGGEIAFKEYGISDAGVTDLFFTPINTAVQTNRRIVDNLEIFDVYRVEKFPTHYEVIAKSVVS